MPRTVDEGFRDFLTRLTPSSTESDAAKAHRASIEARLKNDFGLLRFFRTGSFGNGTSISGYSDVDYLASLPYDQVTQSSNVESYCMHDACSTRCAHRFSTKIKPRPSNNSGLHNLDMVDGGLKLVTFVSTIAGTNASSHWH